MPYHSEKSVGLRIFIFKSLNLQKTLYPRTCECLSMFAESLSNVPLYFYHWQNIFYITWVVFLWYGWTYNAYWQWTSCNSFHCFNPIAFRLYSWRHNSELINVSLTGSWLFLPCLASDLGKATFTGMESKLKLIRFSLILVSAVLHQSLLVRKKFLIIRGCDVIKFRSFVTV